MKNVTDINVIIPPHYQYSLREGERQQIKDWVLSLFDGQETGDVSVCSFCTDSFMDNLNDAVRSGNGNLPELDPSWKQRYILLDVKDVNNSITYKIEYGSPSMSKYFGSFALARF